MVQGNIDKADIDKDEKIEKLRFRDMLLYGTGFVAYTFTDQLLSSLPNMPERLFTLAETE